MLRGTIDYQGTNSLINQVVPEFHTHDVHLPKRDESVMDTVLRDHSITILNIGKTMLYGAGYGFIAYLARSLIRVPDKRIVSDRTLFQPFSFLRRARTNVAYGALFGLFWYGLHDCFLCPHGNATFQKHLISYTIAGSAFFMTFFNPSYIVSGGLAGLIYGLFKDLTHRNDAGPMPLGLEIDLPNYDPVKRAKVIREEQQLELSNRLRKNYENMKSSHYIL